MPSVAPSQVVDLIDQLFPWTKLQLDGQQIGDRGILGPNHAGALRGVVDLIDQIPAELITIQGADYSRFVLSTAIIRDAIIRWHEEGSQYGVVFISFGERLSPVSVILRELRKCPDEVPSPQTVVLTFIDDSAVRESLRLDISGANQSLLNREWKAATVLAGSALEALLLWRLSRDPDSSRKARAHLISIGRLTGKSDKELEAWNLGEYIEVALHLEYIRSDSAAQGRLAKDFRNLIHPGRAIRKDQLCNRATALSAIAAVEHAVADLDAVTGGGPSSPRA